MPRPVPPHRLRRPVAPPAAASAPADPTRIHVASGHGRLYIHGDGAHVVARQVPGALYNPRRRAYECALTLPTLQAIRAASTGHERHAQFARLCEPSVIRWARAATASEARVTEVHQRLAAGYRATLPWRDFTWAADGFDAPRQPFAHQSVMATAAIELDGVGFICDVGTGKTRAAVEALAEKVRTAEVQVAVIVCPKKVIRTWLREIDSWARGTLHPQPIAKGRAARLEQVRGLRTGDVLIVNYDLLKEVEALIAEHVNTGMRSLAFIADEMHRLRNPTTQRSKAALALAQRCVWRLGLTGSPVLQGVQDVWAQWYILDFGVTFGANFVTYRHQYTTTNPWTFALEPRPGALATVGEAMRRRGIRYTKEECLDLPPRVYEVEDVEMTPEQARAYQQMKRDLVVQLESGGMATAANQLSVIMRLAQITSGFLPGEAGMHRFTPNPKLDELVTLVEEHIGQHQILVWAWYHEDVRAICERLAHHQPVTIVGGQHERDSTFAEEAFQRGERRLLVANPGAGGAGLNLQAASLAIYYSQSYALEHRIQSEGRCHRSGSERHERVTYIDLVCRGTVDEVVRTALARKDAVADTVTNLRRHLGLD